MQSKQGWEHDNDWRVEQWEMQDGSRDYILLTNDDLDVSVYIEEWGGEDERTVYGVGIHDTTIAAHPSIPGSVYEEQSWKSAMCRVFELVQNVDEHIENMRTSAEYRRAAKVAELAPPTRDEGGVIPGFEVRNREGKVYDGRMTLQEAVDELEGDVLEKHEERMAGRS